MKHVRSDRNIDIREREVLPKRVVYGLETSFTTSRMKTGCIFVSQKKCVGRLCEVSGRKTKELAKPITRDDTLGTAAIVGACHKCLFGVVANKGSENGMAPAPGAIPAHHHKTPLSIQMDWV